MSWQPKRRPSPYFWPNHSIGDPANDSQKKVTDGGHFGTNCFHLLFAFAATPPFSFLTSTSAPGRCGELDRGGEERPALEQDQSPPSGVNHTGLKRENRSCTVILDERAVPKGMKTFSG